MSLPPSSGPVWDVWEITSLSIALRWPLRFPFPLELTRGLTDFINFLQNIKSSELGTVDSETNHSLVASDVEADRTQSWSHYFNWRQNSSKTLRKAGLIQVNRPITAT
jgi:hypothetical protein